MVYAGSPELESFANATIGGVIAAGLSGPRRASAGGLRDFVLGTVLLNGQGERLVFGGQVMKNVAGYDVSRLLAGSMGLAIGSTVSPKQIGLVFSIILVPITFLGCVYYSWAGLSRIPWLQWCVLINPIVYMSEGLRAAVTPSIPHMPWWAILLALVFFTAALGRLGLRGFLRRVLS